MNKREFIKLVFSSARKCMSAFKIYFELEFTESNYPVKLSQTYF